MRIAGALLAVGALFGVLVVASAASEGPGPVATARLALPAPGEVRPDVLDDGTPVFVVARPDGAVHVVGAINPHLDRLVVWCARARSFFEPGPASRWDERGLYLAGPAAAGLVPYALLEDDEERGRGFVVVGQRLPAPGRDVPALRPAGPACDWDYEEGPGGFERMLDAVGHDLDEVYGPRGSPEEAEPARPDRAALARYDARVEIAEDGTAVVCSLRPDPGCPGGSVPLHSTYHPDSPASSGYGPSCVGHVDGELLARRVPAGFADAALYPQFTAVGEAAFTGFDLQLNCAEWPEWVHVTGVLVAVEDVGGGRWEALLADEAGVVERVPLDERFHLSVQRFADDAVGPGEELPQTSFPAPQLPDLLEETGPLHVELTVQEDGVARSGYADWLG